LIDSDDEDEDGYTEPMQENTAPQQPKDVKGKAAQAAPPKQGYGLFDEDEDMDDDLGSDQTGQCRLLHCSILSSQLAFCCSPINNINAMLATFSLACDVYIPALA